MIGLEEQLELFKLIGSELKKKIECIVIGGSAMLFYGLKTATKDIDIVFLSELDRKNFKNVLEKIGFKEKEIIKKRDKRFILMERKDIRFDLFMNKVIKFKISPGILDRIREVHEFGNLFAKIISHEDIILLKCATDREGDRLDAKEIIERFGVNWNIIINEAMWQTKEGGKIFTLFLYDFLTDLKEDFKIKIPKEVIKKLKEVSEEEISKLE